MNNYKKVLREKSIEGILAQLKPNTYLDRHSHWSTLQKLFDKASTNELGALSTLMTCTNTAPGKVELSYSVPESNTKTIVVYLNREAIAKVSYCKPKGKNIQPWYVEFIGDFRKYCFFESRNYKTFRNALKGINKIVFETREFTELLDATN